MSAGHKPGKPLQIRLSREQRRRLKAAVKIVAAEKGERVGESELLRDLAMPAVDRILSAEPAATT